MAAQHSTASIADAFGAVRIIPVLTIDDAEDAVPLARALAEGGLTVIEITLRTNAAVPAISAIAAALDQVVVGAGTVTAADELGAAHDAGAKFIVTPGLSETVLDAAEHAQLPCLPGVATATEMMRAQALGLTHVKFFPASVAGGPAGLKAFGGPFPRLRFCPTGGVAAANLREYLALPNVFAVGGSWMAPGDAVRAKEWDRIAAVARAAVAAAEEGT